MSDTNKKSKILVVDDELGFRDLLSQELNSAGHEVDTASDGEAALEKLKNTEFQLVICDEKMPKMSGMKVLEEIKNRHPDTEVIICTGFATVEIAIAAMKKGAYDFILKPYNIDELLLLVARSLEKSELRVKINKLVLIEEQLRILFEYAPDAYFLVDSKGNFIDGNKKAEEIFGCQKDELIGKNIFDLDLLSQDQVPKVLSLLSRNVAGAQSGPGAFSLNRKDKKQIIVEISVYPVNIKEKSVVLAIARDVTERKRTELEVQNLNKKLTESSAQLIQSEKMSALGELTAGISHELNQPLNGVKIICQSLLRDMDRETSTPTCNFRDELNVVIKEINRMAAIISHMMIFTRSTAGTEGETVDMNDVIRNSFKFTAQQLRDDGIEIIENFSSNLPLVEGNPIRLEQVILNLMTNARYAVITSKKNNKKIEIATAVSHDQKNIVIDIKDNGVGVPERLKDKIFLPFFTTKDPGQGVGLGLSISSKIIEDHKGRIELTSPPIEEGNKIGEGSLFRIILPISADGQ